MAKRKRDVPVLFWVSAEELELIRQKMQQYGTENLSAYLRKMAVDVPGNGTIPAVYAKRLQLAKHAGMAIMDMVNRGVTARQIINERSIRNAL